MTLIKAAEIKLPFGLDENNILVHIADAQRGKKCACVCPSCKTPLIAAKGSEIQHHFKHDSGDVCERGLESAIHLAAKQILKEKKQITLPECVSIASEKDSKGIEHTEREIVVQNGKVIEFHSVEAEKELHGMKADILAIKDNQPLIIEIFYRHKVDDEKLVKIAKSNVSAIEINLSDLTPQDVKNWETFWSCINDPQRVKWLYNAKANDAVYRKLESRLIEKIQAQEKKYKREEIEKQRRYERENSQFLQALSEVKRLRSKDHIAQLNRKAENHPIWQKRRKYLPFSWQELPDFLDVEVPDGDWIFGCDRRIWQIAFYSSFICKAGGAFSVKRVDEWLQNKIGCKVPSSVKTMGVCASRRDPKLLPAGISLPSSWRTLKAYFWYLCELGILESTGSDWKNPGSEWFRVMRDNAKLSPVQISSRLNAAAACTEAAL